MIVGSSKKIGHFRLKKRLTEWERSAKNEGLFSNYTTDRGLIFRIHKELKIMVKETNEPIK